MPVGPTKVKALKSILFTEGTLTVKKKDYVGEATCWTPIDYITSVNVPACSVLNWPANKPVTQKPCTSLQCCQKC